LKFGYARVSTIDQNLELQIDELKKAGCDKIFQEKVTGTRKDRPELAEMLKMLRPGDKVVVWKLDRIGRSFKHLIELIEHFKENKIEFISLKENIDTTSATGKLIFNIFASLSEFEREMISERTKAGLAAARARGREGGRPKVKKEKIDLALKMYKSKDYSISEIIEATGIGKTTLYRYLSKHSCNT
jgi:DNA invertase Pin-like site-specific DNA recombinase